MKPKALQTVPLDWIPKLLDVVSDQIKLCILLTLNCGFGAGEIGQLLKGEYNSATGRIIHKRCKTQKSKNTPTVCYKLWEETKELLDKEIARCQQYPKKPDSAPFLLINRNGSRLWYEVFKDGRVSKNDTISRNFNRLVARLQASDPNVPEVSYYQLRKTSATLIYNEPKYRIYNELWLAHSPRSVADRHYNAVEDTILDDCIAWLHSQYFGFPATSDSKNVKTEKG